MKVINFINNLFKKKYPKVDKLQKGKDFIYFTSEEGLEEDEVLKIISNELLGD